MEPPSFFQCAPAPANVAHLSYEEAAELTRCVLVVKNGRAAFVEAESALNTSRQFGTSNPIGSTSRHSRHSLMQS